ncbi:MAG TPA: hypothetical protein VFA87_01305 [Rhizomicrobium sp.]|nr:hypothetical protein [Rhizomicrobium sp.]
MPDATKFLAGIDPSRDDRWSKWASLLSAVFGGAAAVAGFSHWDYPAGVFGIGAALAGIAATIFAGRATQKRDNREAFLTNNDGQY